MVHPKLLKYRNANLAKVRNLDTVEQDIAGVERDLEILKQRLPPKLQQYISVDEKELDSLKQRVQTEKQKRQSRTTR